MSEIKIGDIIRAGVYVCNEWKPAYLAAIVWISDDGSVCKVDKGTPHGCSPWYCYEATKDLRVDNF